MTILICSAPIAGVKMAFFGHRSHTTKAKKFCVL